MKEIAAFCLCGCKTPLYGSRMYFPGHKPKKINKTKEERSAASRKMWDARGRIKEELKSCACGCKKMVKGKWAWGHHSRVNNISKREDIRKLRSEKFVKLHEEGKLGEPWNRGLTINDPRVAAAGRHHSENFSEEHRLVVSRSMKQSWRDGKIVPLTSTSHPNWKGGTSRITERMRGSHQMYTLWKRPILERDGFLCRECGAGENLVVHHDKEKFADILRNSIIKIFGNSGLERELSFEEADQVIEDVLDHHVVNKVSGLTLCEQCHSNVHLAA